MPGKRIAVIGAGVSGLGAIKICLEEGLEPTCFEGTNDIGGLWRYQVNSKEYIHPDYYKSATSNTSKEMTTYRDYPSPDRFPNYLHNSRIMEYLRMYAQHFDLTKHIRFLVHSVRKRSDFSCTDVLVETTGKQESYVFDGIMVCSGLHTEPILPLQNFPGINRFKGQYTHSCEYRSPEKFQGKKIIVVGIGNSGADLAIELSHVASQVYLSTRRGTILNKFYPTFLINRWAENKLNARFNHDVYGLLPKHRLLSHQATCGDDLPNHIISGRVLIKSDVREFTETSAIFGDGTEEDLDVVIFATGYTFSFPFLENNATVLDSQHSMFKFVFPPQLEKPTLAFIGILQPVGATIPTSELQSRWAMRVFKGMRIAKVFCCKTYVKLTFTVSEIYMDEIVSEIGAKPNLPSIFLWDPKLAIEIFFGPCTPYQYRLQGPGKWAGARRAILIRRERIIKPLRTRTLICDQPPSSVPFWLKSACAALLFVLTLVIIKG
uniref:Flavin-containing monooxygenase n=1 Tax=Lynx canadensis TaxID=61383 RepID=A0A667HNT3_LYNCA